MPYMWLSASVLGKTPILSWAREDAATNRMYSRPTKLDAFEIKALTNQTLYVETISGFFPHLIFFRGAYLISDKVKDAIERLEPCTHQIIKLHAVEKNTGQELPQSVHLLNVTVGLDSLSKENSDYREVDGFFLVGQSLGERRTLHARSIELHHLWRDNLFFAFPFISDQLKNVLGKIDKDSMEFLPCSTMQG